MDTLLLQQGGLAGYITAAGRGTCCIHYSCREETWLDTLLLQGGGLFTYITAEGKETGLIHYCCNERD